MGVLDLLTTLDKELVMGKVSSVVLVDICWVIIYISIYIYIHIYI